MAYEQFTDADFTTLGANYTSGGSSIQVAAAAGDNGGFPSTFPFRITILDQGTFAVKARLKVTASADSTHLTTISDGLDANCVTGDIVQNVINKNALLAILADGCQEDTYANLATPLAASGPYVGATLRQTDGPYDWRWNGSIWVPRYLGLGTVTLPPASGWTWDNQGGGSFNNTYGSMRVLMPRTGAVNARMLYRTAPSTPWKATFYLQADTQGAGVSGTTGSDYGFGVAFRDSGGKIVAFYTGANNIIFQKWNSTTSFSGNYNNYSVGDYRQWVIAGRNGLWMRLQDNGTNVLCDWSLNGKDWTNFDTRARTDFMGSGPNAYGPFCYVNGDQVEMIVQHLVES